MWKWLTEYILCHPAASQHYLSMDVNTILSSPPPPRPHTHTHTHTQESFEGLNQISPSRINVNVRPGEWFVRVAQKRHWHQTKSTSSNQSSGTAKFCQTRVVSFIVTQSQTAVRYDTNTHIVLSHQAFSIFSQISTPLFLPVCRPNKVPTVSQPNKDAY